TRGKGERPRATTSGDRAHIPRPPERFGRESPLRFRQNVVASDRLGHRRVTNGGYGNGCSSAVVIVRSNGASQWQGGLDVGRRDAAVVRADRGGAPVRGGGHPHPARVPPAQMGGRAADRGYRRGRGVPLRARLPRAPSP